MTYAGGLYSIFTVQFWKDFTDGSFYGESFHQAFKLIRCKLSCFISGPGPLEMVSRRQPFSEDHIAIAFEYKATASICFRSSEEKQCSFFQRIQPIVQADVGGKAIYPFPEVDAAATDNNLAETNPVPKHERPPSSRFPGYGPEHCRTHRSACRSCLSSVPGQTQQKRFQILMQKH